jgi:hypothetical protein
MCALSQLMKSLPEVVPGSHLVSHGLTHSGSDYEIVYTVTNMARDLKPLKKLTLLTVANSRLFSLVFCGELDGFASVEDLGRFMLTSFETFVPDEPRRLSASSAGGRGEPKPTRTANFGSASSKLEPESASVNRSHSTTKLSPILGETTPSIPED